VHGLDYLLAGKIVCLCKEGLERPEIVATGFQRSNRICQLDVGSAQIVDFGGLGSVSGACLCQLYRELAFLGHEEGIG